MSEGSAPLVFVDSSAVIGQQCQFANAALTGLRMLGQQGVIKLLTTDVVVVEIKRWIRRQADTKAKELERLRRSLVQASIADPHICAANIETAWIKALDDFLDEAGFEVMCTLDIPLRAVFPQWEQQTPPFSLGKTREFPDAFSLAALRLRCSEPVTIVSMDGDFAGIPGCAHEKELQRYVSELVEKNASYDHAKVIGMIQDVLDVHRSQLLGEFSWIRFDIRAESAVDVTATGVSIDIGGITVLSAPPSVSARVMVTVSYILEAQYESASIESPDPFVRESSPRCVDLEVEVSFEFDSGRACYPRVCFAYFEEPIMLEPSDSIQPVRRQRRRG
jgi:hypothetical protein